MFLQAVLLKKWATILYLDGHGSRWISDALSHLEENNVVEFCTFCLPAQLSICTQANDNGFHASVHGNYSKVMSEWRLSRPDGQITVSAFNSILVEAIRRTHLRPQGIISGFNKTGLHPWNPRASRIGISSIVHEHMTKNKADLAAFRGEQMRIDAAKKRKVKKNWCCSEHGAGGRDNKQ